ncbi:MAG: TetR/AcrR family transcriptional regulator [Proteobacteria bacterium]|nr:TetR/AcrR family transcriptional regulator [Pseudomonadota bacterium]MBU1741123.1 TetR/AcrR family transcriptional regulator [Pseudomonadota bacterium]
MVKSIIDRPRPRPGEPEDRLVPSPAKNRDLIQEKRRRIVAGATRVFFEKGFHRTTIREIALASGMSMGQLYHYISSKDDILFLVYEHMQALWFDHLATSGIEEIADPGQRLTRALRCTLEFIGQHKDLFLFIYTETKYLDRKHLRVVLAMDDRNVVGFWRRLILDVGWAGDELEFAANLVSFLMVFLVLRGWNLEHGGRGRDLDDLIDFTLRGLGLLGERSRDGGPR